MSSNDVRFDMVEGVIGAERAEPGGREVDQEEARSLLELPPEQVARALRRMQRRQARLRAD
ncbi:hypothetical protein [Candidatus Chloroploca sp. Khr17]|uniref:hypothetical protein n=1 Tax=Candidatus Chloroploca sp. Khr17 TaxID=2496869 RepID=UPI00101B78F2|nr:hypothetical protein [Candidatus Chloroploca sp. Khr17]